MSFQAIVGHEHPKAVLQAALHRGQVAHAYLFVGDDAIGKRLTALQFAAAINCDQSLEPFPSDSCNTCRSCRHIEAGCHPDVLVLEPDADQANPQIKIDRIREVEHHTMYPPLIGRRKICLINEADRLTLGATNALLKTLEEPPAHSVFILVTSRPFSFPATVPSRCLVVRFAPPARTQVEAAIILRRAVPPADARFLAIWSERRIGQALEADLAAVRAQQREFLDLLSPASLQSVAALFSAIENISKAGRTADAVAWVARWIRDLLIVKVGSQQDEVLNLEHLPVLTDMAGRLPVEEMLGLLEDIDVTSRAVTRNVNVQLALETLVFRLRRGLRQPVTT